MKSTGSKAIPFACRFCFTSEITCSWSSVVFVIVLSMASIFWTEVAGNEKKQEAKNQAVAAVSANMHTQPDSLAAKAQLIGQVPVILRLNMHFKPDGNLSAPEAFAQRNAIADAEDAVIQSLAGMNATKVKKYQYVPYMAVTVNATALQALAKNPMVIEISDDVAFAPSLAESTGVVSANAVWDLGYDGSGWAVAVLDTGVDKYHNFLSGKVVSEACYSTGPIGSLSLCPGQAASSTAAGSGLNCSLLVYGCDHGTHVAGIVAGKDYTTNGPGYNGIANGANIIAIQVYSQFAGPDCLNLGMPTPCVLSYLSDVMLGLERVYALRTAFNIAAVNLSLGGGRYTSNCDSSSLKAIIDNLRVADIATVIASGNDDYTTAMSEPACISSAVSVGATCDSATAGYGCTAVDDIPGYSNIASFISLLAPGSLISSSTPGTNTFQSWHGTSMAAPHVAGAWALMKQRDPGATVSTVLAALQNTGTIADDQRASGSVTGMRRINIDKALLPQLTAPAFIFPSGGETLLAATTINVTWNTNGAPLSSYYNLAYGDNCTPDVFFSDDMESGGGLWSISHGAGTLDWVLGTGNPHSEISAWFASDPATASDQYLSSAGLLTVPANGQLNFWHSYDTEANYDGGVVEISTDGVVWNDLGPYMTQGGYNSTIPFSYGSPIGGRAAFSGNSGGYIETQIDLGSYSGQPVYIRFRMASDSSYSANGWYVDDVSLSAGVSPWMPIGTTSPGASSWPWNVPLNTGDDYCLSIQGMAPGYANSQLVITNPFTVSDVDSDGDGVLDTDDNCILHNNPDQQDTDGDGHGNICDADFDNSCATNIGDLVAFRQTFLTVDPEFDLNSSGGAVNIGDLVIFKQLFLSPPGPSAAGLCNN